MRNGNIKEDVLAWQNLGSYPTYEEWKHSSPQLDVIGYESSYPTYEEWKPSGVKR